jgi:hypothetical protein
MMSTGQLQRVLFIGAATLIGNAAFAQQSHEFDEGHARGYKDGFDAGYRKGAAEARPAADISPKGFPIAVTGATYGPEDSGARCDATRHVRREANGRRSASVAIDNSMCGDPAPGKRKSAEITYLCGSVAKTASAYEHRSAYLSCD